MDHQRFRSATEGVITATDDELDVVECTLTK